MHRNILKWTEYYLNKNNNSVDSLEDTCKKLATMLHLYDTLEDAHTQQHDKVTLCYKSFEMVYTKTQWKLKVYKSNIIKHIDTPAFFPYNVYN